MKGLRFPSAALPYQRRRGRVCGEAVTSLFLQPLPGLYNAGSRRRRGGDRPTGVTCRVWVLNRPFCDDKGRGGNDSTGQQPFVGVLGTDGRGDTVRGPSTWPFTFPCGV